MIYEYDCQSALVWGLPSVQELLVSMDLVGTHSQHVKTDNPQQNHCQNHKEKAVFLCFPV